jgi:hypothetical protein
MGVLAPHQRGQDVGLAQHRTPPKDRGAPAGHDDENGGYDGPQVLCLRGHPNVE